MSYRGLHTSFFFEGQTGRMVSKSNLQLVSLRKKSRVRRPYGVHYTRVFSALEKRNCFYRERVLKSFRVKKLDSYNRDKIKL